MSLDENLFSSATKISGSAEHEILGTVSKNCARGSLEVNNSEWCHFHFYLLISGPMNLSDGRNNTIYEILIESIYSLLVNLAADLQSITT